MTIEKKNTYTYNSLGIDFNETLTVISLTEEEYKRLIEEINYIEEMEGLISLKKNSILKEIFNKSNPRELLDRPNMREEI